MCSVIDLHLDTIYWNAISDGTKTFEGRLLDEKRKKMIEDKVQYIQFICNSTDGKIIKQIKNYYKYETFLDAARDHWKEMIPWAASLEGTNGEAEKAAEVYCEFFSKEQEKKYGVVLIEF